MSHSVQWSPAPARDHNECLARFKPCHEIRARSPSATPITTASPAAAPSLQVKESRPTPSSSSPQHPRSVSSACSSPRISPFRSSPPSSHHYIPPSSHHHHHIPTANVTPFCQDFSKGPATVHSKALPLIPESSSSSSSQTPLRGVSPFFFQQDYPKTPSPHKAPGDSPKTSPRDSPKTPQRDSPKTPPRDSPRTTPTKNSPPRTKDPRKTPAVLPFFQEASNSSSSLRQGSISPKPATTPPPKKTPSPLFQEASPIPTTTTTTTSTQNCVPPWLVSRCAVAPARIIEEEDYHDNDDLLEEALGKEEAASSKALTSSCSSGLGTSRGSSGGTGSTTGGSQSKSGYSRMWEDPVGDRHAIPLYNRLNFSTVPRKTSAKKTWTPAAAHKAGSLCGGVVTIKIPGL